MKKMIIYEPAMCCSTGLCGVSVDPQLLRISTVLSSLNKNGIKVVRYNLSSAPQEFVKNTEVNKLMSVGGVEVLPITVLDGEIVKKGSYPTNDELARLLNVPKNYLGVEAAKVKVTPKKNDGGCNCKGGCC
ncbi:arsenical resistance operon trans-acting repressor ArsD [Hydrogenoanaerobacterium saccharovorans]|uniref:Arsenical resistance operon trans-acting repressor ArsD n=1 Tax=Hydrogenoanaerobacterium saccharovorans TaxID=474960 RepID=A0A1H8BM82_9FIRM|nr:arsenite efflux transporter metallochaperone ArsD [Hydrogenoanaerobacterium saccharovorans]RPF47335.1 arsenical resistance operon trans-acting repressor ArsD [Hydrogenoanaerobacterium saccharovorans]SEM83903.1 Arsenical resistance operon trans-acting repressor ArsD [Hydrogenoanaerobacterium saccharovorans]